MTNILKIGLDCDDTILAFMQPYIKRFGLPKSDYEVTKNVFQILRNDKKWWLNQSVIHRPDFKPTLYCTKRVHPKNWTKLQLKINNLPLAPIYQIYTQSMNKADRIKGKVDVFIDDSVNNFKQLLSKGVPCLLIDSPFNRDFQTEARIYSLNYKEIEQTYNKIYR